MCHGFLLAAILASPAVQAGSLQRYEFRARHMGVEWKIALYAPKEAAANRAAKAAFARIGELNRVFSDYEPDSELMRLCRTSRPGRPVKVSRELFEVLSHSQSVSKDSGGAFDVTVGHVTRMWRNARRRKRFPKPAEIQVALKKTGYRFVKLDTKNRTVELLQPGMRLDLGGIAKGYAADAALAVLKKHGITRAMIDGSGDIVLGDPPPGAPGWKIAIESLPGRRRTAETGKRKPETGQASPSLNSQLSTLNTSTTHHSLLTLKNRSIATSGDAYQFIEFHGKRYSHIVDPKTGLGLTNRSSVTVIAPAGWQADAWASAVSVLGPDRGLRLIAEHRGLEASISVIRDGKTATRQTRGFTRFLPKQGGKNVVPAPH